MFGILVIANKKSQVKHKISVKVDGIYSLQSMIGKEVMQTMYQKGKLYDFQNELIKNITHLEWAKEYAKYIVIGDSNVTN